MKTKYLDNEIERLNLMYRTEDLSDYGNEMLAEFKAIKIALTIPVVIVPKGTLCLVCKKEKATLGIGDTKNACPNCWNKMIN